MNYFFAGIFLFIVWINAHVKYLFKNIENEWDEEHWSHQTPDVNPCAQEG